MNCYNAHLSIGVHSSLEQKKKKKIYFTFTLLYLFFILSCFSPFSVSLSLSISSFFLLEHSQTLSLWPPWMKPSSSASFSHGHSPHHQRWWWFLVFLSLKPRPKCLDLLSKSPVLKSWSQGHQWRWLSPIRLQREKEYKKKKWKENSTMRKEFTPFINLFSESTTVGFWVCWFFWVSLLLCFSIWLCWFFCFLFFSSSLVLMGTAGLWLYSDFYGIDGCCGGVLIVEWNIILL